MADAVGNGHWSVGGGMHVGGIDGGVPASSAVAKYSKDALMDTRAWGHTKPILFLRQP